MISGLAQSAGRVDAYDGKPDLLLFSWEDYKRRFSHLCSTDELERLEEEIRQYREESNDLRDV